MSLLNHERCTLRLCPLSLSSHHGLDFCKVNTTFSWLGNGENGIATWDFDIAVERCLCTTLTDPTVSVALRYMDNVKYQLEPGAKAILSLSSVVFRPTIWVLPRVKWCMVNMKLQVLAYSTKTGNMSETARYDMLFSHFLTFGQNQARCFPLFPLVMLS